MVVAARSRTKWLAVVALAVGTGVAAWLIASKDEATRPEARTPVASPALLRAADSDSAAARYAAEVALARARQDARNPLATYVPTPGLAGRIELDRIFVEGVPRTEQSVRAVRALFGRGLSNDEKVALVRILGGLYAPDNPTGHNADVLLDLRALVGDSNREVARSAALSFARLGYLPGSDALLKSAFEHQVLNADDYYGELAHMATLAPPEVRDGMLATVRISANAYAADILASSINSNPKLLSDYSAQAVNDLAQLLGQTEPRFGPAAGEFGLTDAVRYANWLQANAQLTRLSTGAAPDATIVAALAAPGTDPRKIMAYLLSPEASPVLASAQLGAPAASLVAASSHYAAQYPASRMLQMAAQEIALKVGK